MFSRMMSVAFWWGHHGTLTSGTNHFLEQIVTTTTYTTTWTWQSLCVHIKGILKQGDHQQIIALNTSCESTKRCIVTTHFVNSCEHLYNGIYQNGIGDLQQNSYKQLLSTDGGLGSHHRVTGSDVSHGDSGKCPGFDCSPKGAIFKQHLLYLGRRTGLDWPHRYHHDVTSDPRCLSERQKMVRRWRILPI